MNWQLAVQVWAFVIFVVCVLDWTLQAIAKRLFSPSWGRKVCTLVFGLIIVAVLYFTVPGRSRHLDYLKEAMVDDIAEQEFNGGGSGWGAWLATKVTDLAADIAVQSMRVEKYGLISIGFIEADWGWSPVSVGFAGIVCRNFFIVASTYETPRIEVELAKDAEGNSQLVIWNNDTADYECSASFLDSAHSCKFEFIAQSQVRIRQEKPGLKDKFKRMLTQDKSVVVVSEPIEKLRAVEFKCQGRSMKKANIIFSEDGPRVQWSDPN